MIRRLPTSLGTPTPLLEKWRADAAVLRQRGAERQAEALESCIEELLTWLREYEMETLTLQQAAEETGFSYSAMQKKVARGELPNAGGKNRPRVRRKDLRATIASREPDEPDLAERVLSARRA